MWGGGGGVIKQTTFILAFCNCYCYSKSAACLKVCTGLFWMMCFSQNNGQLSPSESHRISKYGVNMSGLESQCFFPWYCEWCLMSYVLQIEFISGTKKSAQGSDSSGTAGRWLCWPVKLRVNVQQEWCVLLFPVVWSLCPTVCVTLQSLILVVDVVVKPWRTIITDM